MAEIGEIASRKFSAILTSTLTLCCAMPVTFVPPRTLIHGTGPTTISSTGNILSGEDVEMRDYDEDMEMDMDIDRGDEHGGESLLTKKLVVPGQLVTDDPQFMRYSPSKPPRFILTEQWTWNVY